MADSSRIAFEAINELAFGGISSSYALIGTTTQPARIFSITNSTNENMYISFDGSTDHLKILPNGFKLYDLNTNHGQESRLELSKNTSVYVKDDGTGATVGSVFFEVIYAN